MDDLDTIILCCDEKHCFVMKHDNDLDECRIEYCTFIVSKVDVGTKPCTNVTVKSQMKII